jgi:hypothetical protein
MKLLRSKKMDMQDYINEMSNAMYNERSKTQMNLGDLISTLKNMDGESMVEGLINPDSYRGYYSDLAFEKSIKKYKVKELLEVVERCLGSTYYGYKGGEYVMEEHTPLWIASYSGLGEKIMSLNDDGVFVTEKDKW